MNIRNTAFLFGLCLGILWLFGVMVAYKKVAVDDTRIMPSLSPKNPANAPVIDEVVIERVKEKSKDDQGKRKETETLKFVLKDNNWYFQSGKSKESAIRVDNNHIQGIIDEIKGAVKNEDEQIPSDGGGVDEPRLTVNLKGRVGSKEKDWQLKIGRPTAEGRMVFVLSSGRSDGRVVAVAKSSISSLFFIDVNKFRSTIPFTARDDAVKKIVIKDADVDPKTNKVVSTTDLEIDKKDDLWSIVKPSDIAGPADAEGPAAAPKKPKNPHAPPEPLPEATTGVKGLISKILGLRIDREDFLEPKADVDFAIYGLEDNTPDGMRIQLTSDDLEKKDETMLISPVRKKVDGKYFARMANDPGIFKIAEDKIDAIKKIVKDREELRSKAVVFVDLKKVDKIAIKAGKDEVLLTHPEKNGIQAVWQVRVGESKSAKANQVAVGNLLEALGNKRTVKSYVPKMTADQEKKSDAELGFDSPTLTIELFPESKPPFDEPKKEEPKKEEPKKDDKKPEDKKSDKTEPKKDEKKEKFIKLIVGKFSDKDGLAIKREEDGRIDRFFLGKEFKDKIITEKLNLAYLDTALPSADLAVGDVTSIAVERPKDEKTKLLQIVRRKNERWYIEQPPASPGEENLADTDKVTSRLESLLNLQPSKWVDTTAAADLAKLGLKPADMTVTLELRKTKPASFTAASIVGLLSSPDVFSPLPVALDMRFHYQLALGDKFDKEKDNGAKFEKFDEVMGIKAQKVVLRFGETDKDKETYALCDVEAGKDKVPTNDLVFLTRSDVPRELVKEDFQDRSKLVALQVFLDAGMAGLMAAESAPGQLAVSGFASRGLLLDAYAARMDPTVLIFDPTRVKEVRLEIRNFDLRKFDFVAQPRDKAKAEPDKAKEPDKKVTQPKTTGKTPDKKGAKPPDKKTGRPEKSGAKQPEPEPEPVKPEPVKEEAKSKGEAKDEAPTLKGQTWKDQSGIEEFTLDSEKVNELVDKLCRLQAERIVSLDGLQRPYYKFGSKEFALKIDLVMDTGQVVTLKVGGPFQHRGYFAQVTSKDGPPKGASWSSAVFLLDTGSVNRLREGTGFFGKKDQVAGQ